MKQRPCATMMGAGSEAPALVAAEDLPASASVLRVAGKRKGALADWINALLARKPERLVAVALANKLARICWAVMTTGESFRAEVYVKT